MTYPPPPQARAAAPRYAPPQGYRPYGPPQGFPPAPPPPGAQQRAPQRPQGPPQGAPQAPPQAPPQGPGGGYGYAPVPPRPPVQHTSHAKVLSILVVALVVAAGAFVLISNLLTPGPNTTPTCNPTCGGPPPVGKPVAAKPRFTAKDGAWSVEYPAHDPVFTAFKKSDEQLYAELGHGAAIIAVNGGDAGGKTPQQVVQSWLSSKFPDARPAYEIAHAEVGYTPGYGAIYDVYPQTTSGASAHYRLVLLAAVKNNTFVLVVGFGAYHPFQRGDPLNHPSGASTGVAIFMDGIINSVEWKGDPPR
jgi:hypothetical protein